jgi:sodium/potassium-transporting ATPase subunit alpha
MALKRRALHRTRTFRVDSRVDSEGQFSRKPSWLTTLKIKLKAPFTRLFWEEAFESTDAEKLVDAKLLSYAYFEAGTIEMISA